MRKWPLSFAGLTFAAIFLALAFRGLEVASGLLLDNALFGIKTDQRTILHTDSGKSRYYRPFIDLAIPRLNIARMIGQTLPAALLAASGASQAFVALAPSSNYIRATLIARRSG